MFIKLHFADNKPIFVNPHHVVSFYEVPEGTAIETIIDNGKTCRVVKEEIVEVEKLLQGDPEVDKEESEAADE